MSEERCGTCRFWLKSEQIRNAGICRRRVPQCDPACIPVSYWPETKQGDWCGEFEHGTMTVRIPVKDQQPTFQQNMP